MGFVVDEFICGRKEGGGGQCAVFLGIAKVFVAMDMAESIICGFWIASG